MKITDIRPTCVAIFRDDGAIARNWVFVEIDTDAGITGIGEATTEYHEQAVIAQIESEIKPRLLGMDPTDVERIWQTGFRDFWWRRGVVHTSAMSGIDQALWDIAGKAAGLPVFKMLGGKVREKVRCYVRSGPEFCGLTLEEKAATSLEMGFDAFKHGVGVFVEPMDYAKQIDVAVADFRLLREALGPEAGLMIDCHGLFDPQSGHRLVEALEPLDMMFVEEVLPMETIEPTLRLKRDFPGVKIALGERQMTRWDFRPWFEQQAIDVCQADISHAGGISEMMRIASFAEIYGIEVAPHNPYGPVALAAAAHASAAMPNFLILEHCRLLPWFDKIQSLAVPFVDGHIDVLELEKRPGLGVELDMEVVRDHARHVALGGKGRMPKVDGSTPLY